MLSILRPNLKFISVSNHFKGSPSFFSAHMLQQNQIVAFPLYKWVIVFWNICGVYKEWRWAWKKGNPSITTYAYVHASIYQIRGWLMLLFHVNKALAKILLWINLDLEEKFIDRRRWNHDKVEATAKRSIAINRTISFLSFTPVRASYPQQLHKVMKVKTFCHKFTPTFIEIIDNFFCCWMSISWILQFVHSVCATQKSMLLLSNIDIIDTLLLYTTHAISIQLMKKFIAESV